jgi:hypothetical protein
MIDPWGAGWRLALLHQFREGYAELGELVRLATVNGGRILTPLLGA